MEEYIEVSAKTKEEAIMNAAIQLGTSSDNIEYDLPLCGFTKLPKANPTTKKVW